MTSPAQGIKRNHEDSEMPPPPPVKKPAPNPVFQGAAFQAVPVGQKDSLESNTVWMSRESIEKWFGKNSNKAYVQVADSIYRAALGPNLKEDQVGIPNRAGFEPLKCNKDDQVVIAPVSRGTLGNFGELSCITFELNQINEGPVDGHTCVISLSDLRKRFLVNYQDHYLRKDQKLFTPFFWGDVEAKVISISLKDLRPGLLGRVTRNTQIEFKVGVSSSVQVVDKLFCDEVVKFCFTLTPIPRDLGGRVADLPIKLSMGRLRKEILSRVGEDPFVEGHQIIIPHGSGYDIQVRFDRPLLKPELQNPPQNKQFSSVFNKTGYKFPKEPIFHFNLERGKISLQSDEVKPAQKLRCEVMRAMGDLPATEIQARDARWVDEEEFQAVFRRLNRTFQPGEEFEIVLSSGRFKVRIAHIDLPEGGRLRHSQQNCEEVSVEADTFIELTVLKGAKIKKLANRSVVPGDEVQLEVDVVNRFGSKPFIISSEDLIASFRRYCREPLVKHSVVKGFAADGEELKFTVQKIHLKNQKAPALTELTDQTKIRLMAGSGSQIRIVERVPDPVTTAHIKLEVEKHIHTQHYHPLPLSVDLNTFTQTVLKKLNKQPYLFAAETSVIFEDPSGWSVAALVASLDTNNPLFQFKSENSQRRRQHPLGYKLDTATQLKFEKCHDIQFVNSEPVAAGQMVFKVNKFKGNVQKEAHPTSASVYLSAKELKEKLMRISPTIVPGEKYNLQLSTGSFQVELLRANAVSGGTIDESVVRQSWKLAEETEIIVAKNNDLSIHAVVDTTPVPIEKIKFEVTPVVPKVGFLDILTGNLPKIDPVIIKDSEMLKLLEESQVKHLYKGQEFLFRTNQNQPIRVKIKEIRFEGPVKQPHGMRQLGKLGDKTKLRYVTPKDSKVAVTTDQGIATVRNPKEALKHEGLGGMSQVFDVIVSSLCQWIPELREQVKLLGITPTRGILFVGPPGTGKTKLVKKLSKLAGVAKANCKIVTAPELKNKWVGGTEKNIRNLLDPARHDYETFGEEAPLHIIAIDEIDSIGHKRGQSLGTHDDSAVNQLLTIIQGPDTPPNVLFIGITNRKEALDEALVRSGRFGQEIEFRLPDVKARKEILEIYLQKASDASRLEEGIDLEELAQKTDGWSGADLEDFLNRAKTRSLTRLRRLDLSKINLRETPEGIVTRNDVEAAFKEMSSRRGQKLNEAAQRMYS